MGSEAAAAYVFDRFVLHLDRAALLADGVERALRPKSFTLLRHFVENPGRLIDRDEIMQAVWPGIFVSDDSIAQCVSDIRRALSDNEQRLLRTLPRRAYLFSAQVARGTERPQSGAPEAISETLRPGTPSPALPDKPSIAVLPFQNMSGDPEQEYFADGMVEEITTAIARLPWLFVIARNSAFTYKGKAVDVREVARELGVRYVLEGSVRKAGNRVRITGQLIDTTIGAHIWAERFDGTLDDIFELQDQVASSVAGAIEPRLRQSEIDRAARKPIESLDVYDLYLRALAELHKPDVAALAQAVPLLRQALAIDPSYIPAASLLATARQRQQTSGVLLAAEEIDEAVQLAWRAVEDGSNDPDALARSANALSWLGGELEVALSAADRATTLNPNNAQAWWVAAAVNCFAGHAEPAIAAIERAMRLSPLDPAAYSFKAIMALSLMIAGRYEEGMVWVDRSLHDRLREHFPMRLKVALSGYLGRDDAPEWVRRLLELNPAMTIAGFKAIGQQISAKTMAVWIEGLRRAGLPEE